MSRFGKTMGVGALVALWVVGACSSEDPGGTPSGDVGSLNGTAGTSLAPTGVAGSGVAGAAGFGQQPTAGGAAGTAGAAVPPSAGAGNVAPPAAGTAGAPPSTPPTTAPPTNDPPTNDPQPVAGGAPQAPLDPAGPEDGDPSGPVVEVPGVPCGANPSLFGLTSTNFTIGGRDVHVAYPCNKHAGAPVTFVLNLHGTMPSEELKLYQVAYFSINNYADSHNIISVAPKSVVSQWGNGDGGVDDPHIMEVIDWVYSAFSDFDIRQMWVSGHSWGAMYSTNFACDPRIADKVRGAVLESGSGIPPTCADRLSIISSAAENDIGPVIDLGGIAASHGCGAEQTNMVGNNVEGYWDGCNPGFTYATYFMLGKAHADYMDDVVVARIADLINLARP